MKKQHQITAVFIFVCLAGFALWCGISKCGHESGHEEESRKDVKADTPIKTDHMFMSNVWTFVEHDIPYADEKIFEMIKKAYSNVDFDSEFESGDQETYDDYIQKFWYLLHSDVPFWDRKRNREVFMKDWEEVYGDLASFDLKKSIYYFFDMNGDGFPELCINPQEPVVVFAYDAEKDQYVLWAWLGGKDIVGTRKAMWHPEYDSIICDYFQLNEHGDIELETLFWAEFFYGFEEDINMVMFPNYLDQGKNWVITEEMKQQGVFEESSGQWFFRITDEQFEELKKPYMDAYHSALERHREASYTYEELFGKFEME